MTLAAPKWEASNHGSLSAVTRMHPGAEEPSHLAHDARNWLAALQMYCDLLRTSGVVAAEGEKWMREFSRAVERGYGLVDSLLNAAQSADPLPHLAPKKVASSTPFGLADAIERRLPLLRQMAGSRIRVDVKTVAQQGAIALQELEFERILLNLTRNAIEAMPGGGILKIMVGSRRSSQRPARSSQPPAMVLRVSDTGCGIPTENLPHIFESGVSTKLVEDEASHTRGFGLAIVRELTLGAGGSIRVRSRPGHGTAFAIELPLLSDPLRPNPLQPEQLQPDRRSSVSRLRMRESGTVSEMPKRKRSH